VAPSSSRGPAANGTEAQRKQLGAWYTPDHLVASVVDNVVTAEFLASCGTGDRCLRVLDPSCGDGRFLAAVSERASRHGVTCELVGVDIDPHAVKAARVTNPGAHVVEADALRHDFGGRRFDLVIGNPPFLSQMASATTRGGTSDRSGGPYADAAVEFLALAGELVVPDGGRVALIVPQSLLAARDARHVRASFDDRAHLFWSWWTGERVFDAQVHTCAVAFQFSAHDPRSRRDSGDPVHRDRDANVEMDRERGRGNWAYVVTSRQGIPDVPLLETSGRVGDRAVLNANFRDEYYGMIPAVGDHATGPPLVTSGLIDPGRTWWGSRPVTFAKRRLHAPRIDLTALDPKMQRWASRRLVPKVLVANQTSIIEAVCDPNGEWLPAVPVIGVYPHVDDGVRSAADAAWGIAAVLTSPIASALVWHHAAGTGLSATSIRLGPAALGAIPWPGGDVGPAVAALRDGDVHRCGDLILDAYGIRDAIDREQLVRWWSSGLERIASRAPLHA
jgi:SAM-dependent methyltransferase